jgi:hypothetical protein
MPEAAGIIRAVEITCILNLIQEIPEIISGADSGQRGRSPRIARLFAPTGAGCTIQRPPQHGDASSLLNCCSLAVAAETLAPQRLSASLHRKELRICGVEIQVTQFSRIFLLTPIRMSVLHADNGHWGSPDFACL